jgi:hypothetical protein
MTHFGGRTSGRYSLRRQHRTAASTTSTEQQQQQRRRQLRSNRSNHHHHHLYKEEEVEDGDDEVVLVVTDRLESQQQRKDQWIQITASTQEELDEDDHRRLHHHHVVVTEESSLSDHSHSYPSIMARRRCPKINQKSNPTNTNNRSTMQYELRGLKTITTTTNNEYQKSKRTRKATQFYLPSSLPSPVKTQPAAARKLAVVRMATNKKHINKPTNQEKQQISASKKRPFSALNDDKADDDGRHSRRIANESIRHKHPTTIATADTTISSLQSTTTRSSSSCFQLPYETLLEEYQQKATEGSYETVFFGPTIESAVEAIENQLAIMKEQKRKYPSRYRELDKVDDLEVVADLRDYKKSLRSFPIHEAQEKLALEKERQEYERLTASLQHQHTRKKMNDMQLEWLQLAQRNIVLSSAAAARIHRSSRTNKCPMSNPEQCTLCNTCPENLQKFNNNNTSKNDKTTTNPIPYNAPVPRVRNIEILDDEENDNDDECHNTQDPNHEMNRSKRNATQSESSNPKNVTTRLEDQRHRFRATEIALMQLLQSLQFILNYQNTAHQFGHSDC